MIFETILIILSIIYPISSYYRKDQDKNDSNFCCTMFLRYLYFTFTKTPNVYLFNNRVNLIIFDKKAKKKSNSSNFLIWKSHKYFWFQHRCGFLLIQHHRFYQMYQSSQITTKIFLRVFSFLFMNIIKNKKKNNETEAKIIRYPLLCFKSWTGYLNSYIKTILYQYF